MSDRTSLGDRMKRYELANQGYLTIRTPVIIRVDGRAFHTFSNKFIDMVNDYEQAEENYSFSPHLNQAMSFTAKTLVESIQGAIAAYAQSDEISILVKDYMSLESQSWFDYNINKITSLSASIATVALNKWVENYRVVRSSMTIADCAQFDARAFNLPKEEVTNYFIWRQQDAMRNAVNKVARAFFSDKQLHGLSVVQVKEKLLQDAQFDYDQMVGNQYKRGTTAYRVPGNGNVIVDEDLPVFTEQRTYIERFVTDIIEIIDERNIPLQTWD